MKITKIETHKYWISWCNWLFVRVTTDEGVYGWGEASLHGALESVEAAIHELGAVLIGQDPSGSERHWQAMYHAWRWRGGPTLFSAMAALDIALWDLEGKRLGVPVYRLLGGPLRTSLRGYASHWLSGVTTPEGAYDGAQEAVRRGFTGFKWGPFDPVKLRANEARALRDATALMAAAREGAGPDAAHRRPRGQRLPLLPPRLVRGADPLRESARHDPSPARVAGPDRDRRAFTLPLGIPRVAGRGRLQDRPARSDARGGHHRGPQDRRARRHLLP